MGGCYGGSYGYSESSKNSSSRGANYASLFKRFLKSGNLTDLVDGQRAFLDNKSSGFIAEVAKAAGISDVNQIPKEFSETEYEVKFDVQARGKGEEPSVIECMDALDYPSSRNARFLKDPVNTFAVGINNFYGDSRDERLVVIEKGGGIYLKEKGLVEPVLSDTKYSEIVIKRTEKRWPASFEEATRRTQEVCKEPGVSYRGKVKKEKGDFFILDSNDGRIYACSFTRAHLMNGEIDTGEVQRQLELEYAGYVPGFSGFNKDSEKDIVSGMVDLSRYTYALHESSPIKNGWRMNLAVTSERKYDFISGRRNETLEKKTGLVLPFSKPKRELARN